MSTIVKLSTGQWPYQEIRPDQWADFFVRHPSPTRPYLLKEVPGDEPQRVTPPDDDPVWDEHERDVNAYNALFREFEKLLGFAPVEVPDGWDISPGEALALDLKDELTGRERKLLYIDHAVLATSVDYATFQAATKGVISKEERAAGGEPFPSPDGETEGSVGSA